MGINHICRALLKHRLLGATTRVSDLVASLDVKSRNLYFQVMLKSVWDHTLRTTTLERYPELYLEMKLYAGDLVKNNGGWGNG